MSNCLKEEHSISKNQFFLQAFLGCFQFSIIEIALITHLQINLVSFTTS